MRFSKDCLKIDTQRTVEELTKVIRRQVHKHLRKAGVVLGISGGIDSSVCAALCVRALGPERVLGTIMPETDSDPESEALAHSLAESFKFSTVTENISDSLAAAGCYKRRDEAIRTVFPDYNDDFKSKITLPTTILDKDTFNFFQLTVESPSGETMTKRMPVQAYLQVVAASNLKQRLRMATSYYHAERRNYAVVGTGNKDEHLQGFFVKYGDGGADLKPIAHLFKVQVYQLAEYLGIPKSIIERTPTTDTYSASVTQEEFFFGLDFHTMDMLWHAEELGVPASEAAVVMNLTEEQVKRCYANIKRKITATEYLRMPPLVVCGAQETERHTVCDEQSERQTNNYS